jgi:copper chaperone CopZ
VFLVFTIHIPRFGKLHKKEGSPPRNESPYITQSPIEISHFSWMIGKGPSPIIGILMKRQTYQTLFAVPMTCDSCVKDVSGVLYSLGGITKVEANLADQLVSIEGTGTSVFSFLFRVLHLCIPHSLFLMPLAPCFDTTPLFFFSKKKKKVFSFGHKLVPPLQAPSRRPSCRSSIVRCSLLTLRVSSDSRPISHCRGYSSHW